MLKNFSYLAVLFALLVSPSVFAEVQMTPEEQCKQFSQEDQIPVEEMEDYIAECVKSLIETESQDDR